MSAARERSSAASSSGERRSAGGEDGRCERMGCGLDARLRCRWMSSRLMGSVSKWRAGMRGVAMRMLLRAYVGVGLVESRRRVQRRQVKGVGAHCGIVVNAEGGICV